MDRTACTEPQLLYGTAITLLPYVPYTLYIASVPVQYSCNSIAPMGRTACIEPQCLYSTSIPLLPLWAVRPVQSLSACRVQLHFYSPYRPYGLYRTSMPVQYICTSTPPIGRTAYTDPQCLYNTAIPLLPLWAVRDIQSLSTCKEQLYLYFPYGPYGLYRASVPVQYSYNSTPPMSSMTCTEPQYLYSRAIPVLPLWTVRPVQSLSACTVHL